MKRIVSLVLALMLGVGLLTACAPRPSGSTGRVVCTVFALYDFVRVVLGDNPADLEVVYLLDSGADIHGFKNQMTARDKYDVLTCDLFVYVGGESDEWLKDVLDDPDSLPTRLCVSMDEACDHLYEEMTEGMKEERGGKDEDEPETDEHMWLSLANAVKMCEAICDDLCLLNPQNAAYYRNNFSAYAKQLDDLRSRYADAVKDAEKDAVLFADRYPFRYLCHECGLTAFAAFPGCSTETATTYNNLISLARLMNEHDIETLLLTEHSSVDIVQTLCDLAGRKTVQTATLNAMQSVTAAEAEAGMTYLSVMEQNLTTLKGALNG